VRVEKNSACDGATLSTIQWPRECIVVAIRHKQASIIPRGDTVLKYGDLLVLVARDQALSTVRSLCAPIKQDRSKAKPKS
jgi:CIC family chloride channel protein